MDHITYTQCIRRAADLLAGARNRSPEVAASIVYQSQVWIELARTVAQHGSVR
jgi:hypothetical protein